MAVILQFSLHLHELQWLMISVDDQTLTVREDILCTLKDNLVMAHNYMKQQEDQGRSKHQFAEGDQVFL